MAYQKISIKDAEGNLIAGSPTFDENNQAVVTIAYESDEANLSGVGVGFNFDATGISVVSVDNVFTGAIASGEQSGDGDAQSLSLVGLPYLVNSPALMQLAWLLLLYRSW